jgi:hypothetical protein
LCTNVAPRRLAPHPPLPHRPRAQARAQPHQHRRGESAKQAAQVTDELSSKMTLLNFPRTPMSTNSSTSSSTSTSTSTA